MFKKIGKRLKDQRGLTLVELLAVVVILGIIAAIAVPSIGNIIQNTKVEAVKADAIQVLNAARMYQAEGGIINTTGVTKTELAQYLENVSAIKDDYKVTAVSDSDKNLKVTVTPNDSDLASTATIDGKTAEEINKMDKGKVTTSGK